MKPSVDQFARWIVRQATATRRRATLARYVLSLGLVGGLFALLPHTPLEGPAGGVLALSVLVGTCWFSGVGPAALMPLTVWIVSRLNLGAAPFHAPTGRELMTFLSLSLVSAAVGLAGQFRHRLRVQSRKHHTQMQEQARALSAARIVFRQLDGRITTWSAGAAELYGWSDSEAVGHKIDDLLHSELPVSPDELQAELLRDGQWRGEVLHRRKDGEAVHVLRHLILYSGEGDRPAGIAEVHTDVTALRRVEEALRESDRRKSQFVAILAHELRNPLAPLRSGLDLLCLSPPTSPDQKLILETMQRQLNHLVRLVNDLLDVSRIDTGKIELNIAPVELSRIVHDAVESWRPQIQASGLQLQVSIPDEPIRLEGDAVRLVQVLSNLLSNAVKFTDTGGTITVQARLDGEQAEVRVRDSGRGISEESLSQIFDMFAQLEDPRQRARDGLGLGLSIVRTIVEMHGGSVTAHSEGEGLGAEFVVRLPVLLESTDADVVEPTTGHDAHAQPVPQRVLVVDDNRDAALLLHRMLSVQGFECRSVFDGRSALSAVADFTPHAVVLDLGMPGMNGLEVARELRRDGRNRKLLLIAVTGWDKEEDRQLTGEAGFDHHLAKPVSFDRLRELIESVDVDDGPRPGKRNGHSTVELR